MIKKFLNVAEILLAITIFIPLYAITKLLALFGVKLAQAIVTDLEKSKQ